MSDLLPIGVRCFVEYMSPDGDQAEANNDNDGLQSKPDRQKQAPEPFQRPRLIAVLDTETATAATAALPGFEAEKWQPMYHTLLFGRALYYKVDWSVYAYELVGEDLFYHDDLPPMAVATLQAWVMEHTRRYGTGRVLKDSTKARVWFGTRAAWLKRFCHFTRNPFQTKKNAYLIGFNLPYDLARLAHGWGTARGKFYGDGFTLKLFQNADSSTNDDAPNLKIKTLAPKMEALGWTRPCTSI